MASIPFIILATTIYIAQVNGQSERYIHNLKVRYFTDVEMHCDHIDLNISKRENVQSLRWIFPDGSMRDANSYLDPKLYQFSGVNGSTLNKNLMSYTLKAFDVDEDVFGYYTCLAVLPADVTPDTKVKVVAIRWGLNVHGADFTELIDTYKENAIIGGIAAAATLVLIAGSCLIWHFCINSNDDKYSENDLGDGVVNTGVGKNGIEMHENSGYVGDKEDKRITDISEMDAVQF